MADKAAPALGPSPGDSGAQSIVEFKRSPAALRIREAILRTLPLEDRLLVVLWYAERLNAREISLVLGVPETQVMRSHDRIVSQLHDAATAA